MKTRTKYFLVALAAIAGLVVAAYAAAPALIAAIASRSLGSDFEVGELRIDSVGPNQLEVAVIDVHNSQMRLAAQGGVVRYDLWPFRIREVAVGQMRLALTGAPGGPPETTSGALLPAPPPFPLAIDELRLEADTPWGMLSLPASVASRPGSAGGFEIELLGEHLSVVVNNPGPDRHHIDIGNGQGAPMLSVDVDSGGWPLTFSGRTAPAKAAAWLRDSVVVPQRLRDTAAPFAVNGDELIFEGRLQQNLDFAATLRGGVQVSDDREAAGRFFHSIAFRASGYEIAKSGPEWSGSGDAEIRLSPVPGNTLKGDDPGWRWNPDGIELNLLQASLEELGLEAESLTVSAPSISQPVIEGRLEAGGLRVSPWPDGVAFYDIVGDWSLSESSTRAQGAGTGAGLPDLDWSFNSSGSAGQVLITGQQAVAPLSSTIRRYTQVLARELKIRQGELDLRYHLEWSDQEQSTDLQVTTSSVAADLDEMKVHGLQARLRNLGSTLDQLELALEIPTLEVAAGATAEDLLVETRLSLPQLHIDQARTKLFGGSISVQPVSINLNDESFTFQADIGDLSLERIMALFELESTELTGEVSGPVRVVYDRERGLEINEGALHSVEPGTLRFSLAADSGAGAQLNNIALRALEDFQYDELNASVLYRPNGEYRITARILGRNPEVLDGHPIALNPTIEGRLPELFRAFFVTGDFSRAIIEKLQQEHNPSTTGDTSTFGEN